MNTTIANNILAQLGGKRFMDRARVSNLKLVHERCIEMDVDLPAPKRGINRLRVLEIDTTYDMIFIEESNGVEVVRMKSINVYASDMEDVFINITGFDTRDDNNPWRIHDTSS